MALDTKIFDDAVIAKEVEVQAAQAAVDADTFALQLKASQELAAALSVKLNEKSHIENKKNRAIELQNRIDADTIELEAIKNSVK